jgi:hypothetical protein
MNPGRAARSKTRILPQVSTIPAHNQDVFFLKNPDRRGISTDSLRKKLVVKPGGFPYQFGQMHRVGAGVEPFFTPILCTETVNNWRN